MYFPVLDREKVKESIDWQTVQNDLRKHMNDPSTPPQARRLLSAIMPFPRALQTLVGQFTGSINPYDVDVNILWGLVDLNLKARIQAESMGGCNSVNANASKSCHTSLKLKHLGLLVGSGDSKLLWSY